MSHHLSPKFILLLADNLCTNTLITLCYGWEMCVYEPKGGEKFLHYHYSSSLYCAELSVLPAEAQNKDQTLLLMDGVPVI